MTLPRPPVDSDRRQSRAEPSQTGDDVRGGGRPARPAGGAGAGAPAPVFGSVLCGADRSVDSRAAHEQAIVLASPGGAVDVVPTPQLTRHGNRALRAACEGHDLLVLGADADAQAVAEHAPIPVLIGRWSACPSGVADTILVAVDDSPESAGAVELAGRLAATHGGTVTVLVAPHRDPALQRAIAASRRIILQATGEVPTVLGEQPPRERAIPATARATNASLVLLGTGDGEPAKQIAAQIAGRIGASTLIVPPPGPAVERHVARDRPDAITPDRPAVGAGSSTPIVPASRVGTDRPRRRSRPRVLIAGAGVAGLETLLALRALAGDRVEITLLAPDTKFVNRSMAVDQPFKPQRLRGLKLHDTAAELDAHWHHGALDRVEHERRRVMTTEGSEIGYDMLVVAVGAHPEREWRSGGVLTYHDGRDGPDFRLLLHRLREGRVHRVAFVKPGGPSWPLLLYDLVLLTAAECLAGGHFEADLSVVTPEAEPLGIFGAAASRGIRDVLAGRGVTLYTSSYGAPGRPGWLDLSPGDQHLPIDWIVTEPRLVGPRLRGIPTASGGFIHTDAHGRVPGLHGVFAAGDATVFPIKQGGLASQQADAVAEAIAAVVGTDIDPRPFRPVLRGLLLTGGPAQFLRADISGAAGDDSAISAQALWWPPTKLAGRYLAPYLSRQVGAAADVMPASERVRPVDTGLDPGASDRRWSTAELTDIRK